MKSIVLHDHEARALQERGRVLLVRPMNDQPVDVDECGPYQQVRVTDDRIPGLTFMDRAYIASPYNEGERCWVRECWATLPLYDGMHPDRLVPAGTDLFWRADGAQTRYYKTEPGQWRPASTMPRWASRATVELERVDARRWQDITAEEVEATGVNVVRHLPLRSRRTAKMVTPGADLDALIAAPAGRAIADIWNRHHPCHPWASDGWAWFVMLRRVEEVDDAD